MLGVRFIRTGVPLYQDFGLIGDPVNTEQCVSSAIRRRYSTQMYKKTNLDRTWVCQVIGPKSCQVSACITNGDKQACIIKEEKLQWEQVDFHHPIGRICPQQKFYEISFILTIDQITLCNVKGPTRSDKPIHNYQQSILVPLSSLFWFYTTQTLLLKLFSSGSSSRHLFSVKNL